MDKIWTWHREDGKLKFDEPDRLANFLRPMTSGEAIFRKAKSQRSLNQNNYYWGVVVKTLAESSGNDSEDVHEFIKAKFNPKFVTIGNEQALVGSTTTKLSTKEFEEKMEEIRAWASIEMGIDIPEPNEVEYE